MPTPQVLTDIANLALTHCGLSKPIQTLGMDYSIEDQLCSTWMDTARRATLKEIPWSFAVKQVVPSLVANNPTPEYLFAYQDPSDNLKIVRFMSWRLTNDTDRSRVPYRKMQPAPINLSQATPLPTAPYQTSGLWIYTNWPGQETQLVPILMEYVFDNTNVSQWPDDFNIAMSYKLAELIISTLTSGDPQNKKIAIQNDFKTAVLQAKNDNVNEDQRPPLPEAEVIRARMGLEGWGYPGQAWVATQIGFEVF
jgi:hypothetical protein